MDRVKIIQDAGSVYEKIGRWLLREGPDCVPDLTDEHGDNLRVVMGEAADMIDKLTFEFERADEAATRLGRKYQENLAKG